MAGASEDHALPEQIQQALAHGWTVLTANQRAARSLRYAFDLEQRALGHAHWNPPPLLAWDTWLPSLWGHLLLEGHASDLLLNRAQEHTIWRAIIAADPATNSLRPADALAQTAAGAWLLLHTYGGARRLRAFPGNSDTDAFARWAGEFERRCARAHYLTQAQLPETLSAAFADRKLTPPSGLLLVGFDRKTPAQTALLETLRTADISIENLTLPTSEPDLTLIPSPDEHQELAACARWLRTTLLDNPGSSLAVIHPSIETARSEIDRVFRHILAPELNDIAAPDASAPWEFSLGVPLARTPMVAAALDILRWAISPLPLDRVSALLLSPHFAPISDSASDLANQEHLARAEFDAFTLRDQTLLQPELTISALYTLVAGPGASKLRVLSAHLRALRPLVANRDITTAERTHAEWAATINDLLDAAGWADPSRDSSIEFQTRRKWESALDELATLDFDARRVSFAAALSSLERIAAETLFAPESRHAPIQIMGPLESAGSTFDAVWFLRTGNLSWPAAPAPNPLLPWPMQRELAMPGADPAREAAYARAITQRIAASAPTVLFSYAQETADGRQRPSPALAGLAFKTHSAAEIALSESSFEAMEPINLEAAADDVPIPPLPDRVLPGGANILEAQAACAFRAFAEKRLFASAIEPVSLGLDARERGSLVHSVLEGFWAQVETQAALKRMPTLARDALLAQCIDTALTKQHDRPQPGWPQAYIAAERQRLLNLLRPWLDYETHNRPPFVVASREEKLNNVPIGPLHLDIRVDRVDHLVAQDGTELPGEIILDYKTGRANPADWLGDRPDAPQLPLYAVVSPSPHLSAIAFANIRPGDEMGLTGYEAHKGILPRGTKLKTATLDAQVDEWRRVLTALATDFESGHAEVAPKQYPTTCRYCKQRLLCRLDVSALEAEAIEDFATDPESVETSAESTTGAESA